MRVEVDQHNWLVAPSDTADQRAVIEKAVGIVRADQPYVEQDITHKLRWGDAS